MVEQGMKSQGSVQSCGWVEPRLGRNLGVGVEPNVVRAWNRVRAQIGLHSMGAYIGVNAPPFAATGLPNVVDAPTIPG